MSAEAALRRTAERYALGADRRDKTLWREVLADDVEITGPGFAIAGLEANLGSIDHLAHAFKATRHVVHDQDVTVEDVNRLMAVTPDWLEGCPIEAESHDAERYSK